MKKRITAVISLLSVIGWGLFGLLILAQRTINGEEFVVLLAILVSIISISLYINWTKFGKMECSELEKVEYENKLLRRQIEQKELRKRLEE